MIRHVVMFKFADGLGDEFLEAVATGLDSLPPVIPEIAAYRHGADLGINDGNYQYVVVGDFASADDYRTYRDHPVHRAFVADVVTGNVAERAAIQFEFEA